MKVDVLIVGGGPAGIITAVTGKTNYPEKEFLVLRNTPKTLVPCGIPYIFGSLENSDKDVISDVVFEKNKINMAVDEVLKIDHDSKSCLTKSGRKITYDKLVLATGSKPAKPSWLKGINTENVFFISKSKEYLDKMLAKLDELEKVVVIGGGFIGVEISDELNKRGKKVTLIELLPHVLGLVFDDEIALEAQTILSNRGINIINGLRAEEIVAENNKVKGLKMENGEVIDADAVIVAIGCVPNTELATQIGLDLNLFNAIKTDEYMRTNMPDVFAVGDCAAKVDFITRKYSKVMLASTACAEARTAGMNLYKISAIKTFSGTIALFSTKIGDTGFGAAGLIEKAAVRENFDVVSGKFEGVDKHPATLPNTHRQYVKLIVSRESGTILGGEVIGGESTGELINLIGLAIQNRMTVSDILITQIGTHPLLTAPPTAYPIIKAAENALTKM